MANLVHPDEELPPLKPMQEWLCEESPGDSLQDLIAHLPAPIRVDLLENSKVSDLACTPARKAVLRCCAARERYRLILNARENLHDLVEDPPDLLRLRFQVDFGRGQDGKLELRGVNEWSWDNWTIKALLSAEVDYLSRCAYGKCGKFFYAVRLGQPGCNPQHSNIIRKQRKRDRDKANSENPRVIAIRRRR